MQDEVEQAVRSCSICAITKAPCKLPVGKLMLLPVPRRPWNRYTVILVVVFRFSKGVWFLPFSSLPTALQVAKALLQSVFVYYGIPEDILCEWGHQVISSVRATFFKKLGASVSLTSAYHPEANSLAERSVQEVTQFPVMDNHMTGQSI